MPGERLGGGGFQHPVRQGPQVRLERPEGLPGVGVPGQRADLDAGVRQQQTEQLPAGVSARRCHCSYHHR
ncbi:hypothetical protein SCALM49S_08270 [Streptomyces californicus]